MLRSMRLVPCVLAMVAVSVTNDEFDDESYRKMKSQRVLGVGLGVRLQSCMYLELQTSLAPRPALY